MPLHSGLLLELVICAEGDALISCGTQFVIAQSSAEPEYNGIVAAANEVLLVKQTSCVRAKKK